MLKTSHFALFFEFPHINNMNDNFQINYGSGTKSLMNYYELLLNQKNNTPSELDKLEICDNYIHTYLPVELHDFYLEKFGMTIYDFITTKVPEMMFDYYRIVHFLLLLHQLLLTSHHFVYLKKPNEIMLLILLEISLSKILHFFFLIISLIYF